MLDVEVGKVTHAALLGMREVQIYGQEKAFLRSFTAYAAPSSKAYALQAVLLGLPVWVLEVTGLVLLLLSVFLLAFVEKAGVATITGTLTLMAAVSWRIFPAMNKLVAGVIQLKGLTMSVLAFFEMVTELDTTTIEGTRLPFTWELELEGISFAYPGGESVLRDVSLRIPKGGMIGLIGLSGSGKSTLVGILTGLLSPGRGCVRVDGQETTPAPGYLNIGYVPQSPYIMDASLAENVAFCKWGEPIDEARVLACCRMAAMDFLDTLPQGIHSVLGDRGQLLSGGQVQRVAIARALYDEPDILLFDEATSALDGAAEASIQNTIAALRDGMTIVIVAHRLSTIQDCDTLYWLDKGRLRRQGGVDDVLPEYEAFLKVTHPSKAMRLSSFETI